MTLRHIGLRAQIVMSLAALLTVVFGFTSVALLWVLRSSLQGQRRELGVVAAQVLVEGLATRLQREGHGAVTSGRLLRSSLGQAGIVAIGHFDARGEPVAGCALDGDGPDLMGVSPLRPRPFQMVRAGREGEEVLLVQPIGTGLGSIVAVVNLGVSRAELSDLARPVLIYLMTSGLLMLGFGYVALTTLIVRPLESLTKATEAVAQGRLDVSVPVRGGREIAAAANAFNTMTRKVREQKGRLESQLQELEHTTRQLGTAQEQLVRSAKLASVGTLAAGLAHEVGNPVSAILGLSEVLLEGGLEGGEEQEYLGRIRGEAERVNRIIRDLLEYSRSSARLDEPDGPASIAEAADTAVKLMGPQKTFRLIDVQVLVEDDLPAVSLGVDQLTQVLLNLLMNAADAVAGQGEVRLRASLVVGDDVPEPLSVSPSAVLVEVSDSGPGVPVEHLQRIFEPFFTTKEPGQGTGLGLAMVEGIVARAGGMVTAHNNPDRGLTVSLYLPIHDDP
jgi:signal transduction histidine kinase